MCTTTCAQPEGHFQRFGGLLTNHPDQTPNNAELSSEKVRCQKVSATFFTLKVSKFQEKCKTCNFSADCFCKWESSLETNIEHMQSRCIAGGAQKELHSLLFSAHRLVHVCWCTLGKENETIYLHHSGPLLENGLDRPKNRYGRHGFPSFIAFPYLS